MVEQGTHKPLDVGSNPTLATQYIWRYARINPVDMGVIKGLSGVKIR